jgi:hypothetical protein
MHQFRNKTLLLRLALLETVARTRKGAQVMAAFARKCLDNCVLTVNGSLEQHLELIRVALAKRAYELFELRGREHGLHFEDWLIAEQELVHRNLNGNGSGFCIFVDRPRDPDITVILSVTIRSLLVFHSRATAAHHPELIAVHLLSEDIHSSQTTVDAVDGVLQVHLSKQRRRKRK